LTLSGGAFAFLWGFIEAASEFGWKPFEDMGISALPWLILLSLYIGIFIHVIYESRVANDGILPPKGEMAEALLNQLRSYAESRDYASAIRFGAALSRPLWLSGEYRARIEVGQIVENAAATLGNERAQAVALIDDVGWTYVALRQFDEAEKNVEHGKQIALRISDYYLVAKAIRHLSGIAIEKKRFVEAVELLKEAAAEAEKIEDKQDKQEMTAGMEYGLSIAYWMKGELKEARKHCIRAKEMYEEMGDDDRIAKTFAQLGKIGETSGDLEFAKDIYRKGLRFAEEVNRKDEIIRNHLGLARIFSREGKNKQVESHLSIARELSKSTPIVFEVGTIERDLELLREENHE